MGQPVRTRKQPGDHEGPAVLSRAFRAHRRRHQSRSAEQAGGDKQYALRIHVGPPALLIEATISRFGVDHRISSAESSGRLRPVDRLATAARRRETGIHAFSGSWSLMLSKLYSIPAGMLVVTALLPAPSRLAHA